MVSPAVLELVVRDTGSEGSGIAISEAADRSDATPRGRQVLFITGDSHFRIVGRVSRGAILDVSGQSGSSSVPISSHGRHSRCQLSSLPRRRWVPESRPWLVVTVAIADCLAEVIEVQNVG